jgi:hypothetical protein
MESDLDVNCDNYNDCPKEKEFEEEINKDFFSLLFVGCWGVYCRDDPECRQKIVSKAMVDYSKQMQLDVVILAGDNVYESIDESVKDLPKALKYDIEKQLDVGFVHCMTEMQTNRFLIGVGNHDLETCEIIKKQIQYKESNWTLPGLSYRVLYQMQNFNINMIFIDTNIYKKKWCRTNPTEKMQPLYPEEAQFAQAEWLKNKLQEGNDKNAWNIVIGHDPFRTRSHKNIDTVLLRKTPDEFLELIKENADSIHLYMCADEHNQQYISDLIVTGRGIFYNDHRFTYCDGIKLPPQIIAGSGGTKLDKEISNEEELVRATKFYQPAFGFVSMLIQKDQIQFKFNGVTSPETSAIDSPIFTIHKQ